MPSEIGGYEIQRVLGQGGMATVYAAMQKKPRRTVALKVIRSGRSTPVSLRRFHQEAEILGRLHHPGIAQVYEAGTHREGDVEVPFVVMEYIPAAQDIREHAAGLDLDAKLRLFVKVCAAVEHAHRRRVIHRDLKPANILVEAGGQPKVIDFGVARAAGLEEPFPPQGESESSIVGTIRYMSPEQVAPGPRDITVRCDVYALGVLLYRLLTDRMPYELDGLPVRNAAMKIREEPPVPPSAVNGEVRGDLERIILRALEKDPAQRYADAGALGGDIVRYLRRRPIRAGNGGPLYRARLFAARHRPAVAAAVVALFVLVGGAVTLAVIAMRGSAREAERAAEVATERAALVEARETLAEEQARAEAAAAAAGPAPPLALRAQSSDITAVALAPAGTRVASGSGDRSTVVFDTTTGDAQFTSLDLDDAVAWIRFGGEHLMTAAADGGLVVLEDADGSFVRRFETGGALTCAALDDAGVRVAWGGEDMTLRVQPLSGGGVTVLRGTTGALVCADFSTQSTLLLAGSRRDTVYLFDAATGATVDRLFGLRGMIADVAFVQSDDRVAAIARSGHGIIWERLASVRTTRFAAEEKTLAAAAFSPGGRWLVTSDGSRVKLWDLASWPLVVWRYTRKDPVLALAIDDDASRCAIGGPDGWVEIVQVTRDEGFTPVSPGRR